MPDSTLRRVSTRARSPEHWLGVPHQWHTERSTIGTGNVSVAKSINTSATQEWTLTFKNSLGGQNVAQVTVNSSSVMYTGTKTNIEATDTQGASSNLNEVQTVTISNANGGTFRLAFDGQVTAPLNHNASSSDVDTVAEKRVDFSYNALGQFTAIARYEVDSDTRENNRSVCRVRGMESELTFPPLRPLPLPHRSEGAGRSSRRRQSRRRAVNRLRSTPRRA